MRYEKVVKGIFIDRPNRFVADIIVDGSKVKAHVKNTGRCRELLVPGAEVYLEDHAEHMGKRKMRYSLIAVKKNKAANRAENTADGNIMVNMDSQAPNKVVKEALEEGRLKLSKAECRCDDYIITPECKYGNSRLDFKLVWKDGREAYIEVKGVTLESDGIASFPDAPTERGIKHLFELERAVREGNDAFVIFVIQMAGIRKFVPNDEKHKEFGDALRHAYSKGVKVLAFECMVSENQLILDRQIRVEL